MGEGSMDVIAIQKAIDEDRTLRGMGALGSFGKHPDPRHRPRHADAAAGAPGAQEGGPEDHHDHVGRRVGRAQVGCQGRFDPQRTASWCGSHRCRRTKIPPRSAARSFASRFVVRFHTHAPSKRRCACVTHITHADWEMTFRRTEVDHQNQRLTAVLFSLRSVGECLSNRLSRSFRLTCMSVKLIKRMCII
jgi:hypothetical protein